MSQTPEAFEITIPVQLADIDELGHVNNVAYLRWVQDAAAAHWKAAAPITDQEKLLWMVLRHEIEYKRAAVLGDDVVAKTWVGNASRMKFERHTELFRAADRRLLAKARTLWCPIDRKTKKPTLVSSEVRACFTQPHSSDPHPPK